MVLGKEIDPGLINVLPFEINGLDMPLNILLGDFLIELIFQT